MLSKTPGYRVVEMCDLERVIIYPLVGQFL